MLIVLAVCKFYLHSAGMNAPSIIAAFGGRKSIAALTGADPDAVTQWRRNGVPSRFWHVLVEHAAATGVDGITFEALAASKPASTPAEVAA